MNDSLVEHHERAGRSVIFCGSQRVDYVSIISALICFGLLVLSDPLEFSGTWAMGVAALSMPKS